MLRKPLPCVLYRFQLIGRPRYVSDMQAGFCLFIIVFFIPETYEPVILAHRAKRIRRETGDNRYFAAIEQRDISFGKRTQEVLAKPFVVLLHEPMLAAITTYMAVRLHTFSLSGTLLFGRSYLFMIFHHSSFMGACISSLKHTPSYSR